MNPSRNPKRTKSDTGCGDAFDFDHPGIDKTTRDFAKTRRARLLKNARKHGRTPRQHKRDQLNEFRATELSQAIKMAASQRHPHNFRIAAIALRKATRSLLRSADKLKRARDFGQLHRTITEALAGVRGVGRLYRYDVALRIGTSLGYLPARVYVQRGSLRGARNLNLDVRDGTVDMSDIPETLRRSLQAHEIEDVLCIYFDCPNTLGAAK